MGSRWILAVLAMVLMSPAGAQEQRSECSELKIVYDSVIAAQKRKDQKVISLAKEVDSLVKQGAVKKECLEVAGSIIRKAAGFCMVYDNYDDGMAFATRAIELLEKTPNKKELANGYTTLGIFMSKRNFFEQAITYLEKGLQIRIESGPTDLELANSYSNIGAIYLEMEKIDKALEYFMKGKPLAEKSGDDYNMGMIYNNIAVCHHRKHNYDEALGYYEKTLEIAKKIHNDFGYANTLSNIGQVYMGKEKFREAASYIRAAELIVPDNLDLQKACYYSLIITYAGLGKADSAQYYMNKMTSVLDSLNSLEHQQDLLDIEAKFSLGQKKEQIEILEKQRSLQRLIIWIFVGATLIIGIALFFLFRSFKEIKKKNKIIEEQKLMVEQKQEEILDSIKYAARIQKALITGERYIQNQLKRMAGK